MKLTRRQALQSIALGGGALALGGCARSAAPAVAAPDPRRAEKADFSFVHLTDMHVRRKRQGNVGYAACVAHVNSLDAPLQLALMGGDLAFDGNYTAKEEFLDQVALYKEISDTLRVPHYAAIGNHDVLGWHGRRRVAVDDPDLGKGIIINRLGLPGRYYSFDHGGWHFVVLDSIHPVDSPENGPVYEPRIGEEQLHWLAHDLGRNTGKPTVVMTHIAAFCALGQINGDASAKAISPMVLADTRDLRHILERHKVKALLQGHSHIEEDYKFRGVWYLTSAAVSGCWWSGTWKGFSQGYTLLHARGEELSWERVVYPWTHVLEPEDNLERERIAEWEAFEAEQRRLLAAEIAAS